MFRCLYFECQENVIKSLQMVVFLVSREYNSFWKKSSVDCIFMVKRMQHFLKKSLQLAFPVPIERYACSNYVPYVCISSAKRILCKPVCKITR